MIKKHILEKIQKWFSMIIHLTEKFCFVDGRDDIDDNVSHKMKMKYKMQLK